MHTLNNHECVAMTLARFAVALVRERRLVETGEFRKVETRIGSGNYVNRYVYDSIPEVELHLDQLDGYGRSLLCKSIAQLQIRCNTQTPFALTTPSKFKALTQIEIPSSYDDLMRFPVILSILDDFRKANIDLRSVNDISFNRVPYDGVNQFTLDRIIKKEKEKGFRNTTVFYGDDFVVKISKEEAEKAWRESIDWY